MLALKKEKKKECRLICICHLVIFCYLIQWNSYIFNHDLSVQRHCTCTLYWEKWLLSWCKMEAQTISEWVCIENIIIPGPQECAVPAFLAAAVRLHHSPEWCAVLWTWLHSVSHTVSCQMWEGFGAQSRVLKQSTMKDPDRSSVRATCRWRRWKINKKSAT